MLAKVNMETSMERDNDLSARLLACILAYFLAIKLVRSFTRMDWNGLDYRNRLPNGHLYVSWCKAKKKNMLVSGNVSKFFWVGR